MENFNTGHFGFSGTPLRDLGATEYTLVTVVLDDSGSVNSHIRNMEKAMDTIVEACRLSPRSDNLMLRLVKFNTQATEVHGFKLLSELKGYDNTLSGNGGTAAYEATHNAIAAMNSYGKTLTDQDYLVNGLLVVITDGENNSGSSTRQDVKKEMEKAISGENLESLVSILVGVGDITSYIQTFKDESGFSQAEMMRDLTPKSLAKLANFVSRSISSQSTALGTGSPSKSLSF